jgi:PAS domain S-box-containing protein
MPFDHTGVVIVDLGGRVKLANNFFCDLIGSSSGKVVDLPWFEFVFAEDLPKAKLLLIMNNHSSPFRFRLRHRSNGSPVLVDVQGTPLAMANGEVYGIAATITPVERANPQVGVPFTRDGWPK